MTEKPKGHARDIFKLGNNFEEINKIDNMQADSEMNQQKFASGCRQR